MTLVCHENFPQKHVVFLQFAGKQPDKVKSPICWIVSSFWDYFLQKKIQFISWGDVHRSSTDPPPPHPLFKFNTHAMIVHYQIMQTLRQFFLLFWKSGAVVYLPKKRWYFLWTVTTDLSPQIPQFWFSQSANTVASIWFICWLSKQISGLLQSEKQNFIFFALFVTFFRHYNVLGPPEECWGWIAHKHCSALGFPKWAMVMTLIFW